MSDYLTFKEVKEMLDAFFTHNWGKDGDNHIRVRKIIKAIQADFNVTIWFDEERIKDQIQDLMVSGLEKSKCVVVFVTKAYVEKVNGSNALDNCKLEFKFAAESPSLGPDKMVRMQ